MRAKCAGRRVEFYRILCPNLHQVRVAHTFFKHRRLRKKPQKKPFKLTCNIIKLLECVLLRLLLILNCYLLPINYAFITFENEFEHDKLLIYIIYHLMQHICLYFFFVGIFICIYHLYECNIFAWPFYCVQLIFPSTKKKKLIVNHLYPSTWNQYWIKNPLIFAKEIVHNS